MGNYSGKEVEDQLAGGFAGVNSQSTRAHAGPASFRPSFAGQDQISQTSDQTVADAASGSTGQKDGDSMDLEVKDSAADQENDNVPTVFRWEHGGRHVYITGTFNNWERQIPMHRSGNDFTYIHNLKNGKHAYKFVVDDEWRFAPDQPTVADIEGRINNYIDVSNFKAYNDEDDAGEFDGSIGGTDGFGHQLPDIDDYTKEPPPLPPHLRHIILNKPPPQNDVTALPVPQHVALGHLYCTAIKDGLMVLGMTQRYRRKCVTTVYYSPLPGVG